MAAAAHAPDSPAHAAQDPTSRPRKVARSAQQEDLAEDEPEPDPTPASAAAAEPPASADVTVQQAAVPALFGGSWQAALPSSTAAAGQHGLFGAVHPSTEPVRSSPPRPCARALTPAAASAFLIQSAADSPASAEVDGQGLFWGCMHPPEPFWAALIAKASLSTPALLPRFHSRLRTAFEDTLNILIPIHWVALCICA